MLNSVGSINPPNWIRVLWCVLEGAIAGGLLLAGGLVAIQMASIIIGLPIAVFLLVTVYSLIRSLRADTMSSAEGLMVMRATANDPTTQAENGAFAAVMAPRELA
jgi:choline-glycine betaine transporter